MSQTKGCTVNEIIIDGETFVRQTPTVEKPTRIVVLQRGWVMVGRWSQDGDNCALDNAHVIRIWGTTKGLGEIATNGPTSKTVLDPAGRVTFHVMTTVVTLDCNEAKWSL